MVKHATSHGLSVFVSTLIAAVIIDLFRPLLPGLFKYFEKYTKLILDYIPLPISLKVFNIIIIASILGVLWGIIFKLRFDRD